MIDGDGELDGDDSSPAANYSPLLASAVSGMIARFPCHPLDTAKARLQVQGGGGGSGIAGITGATQPRYRSLADTLRKTVAREGLKGAVPGIWHHRHRLGSGHVPIPNVL